jgi:hypothetical protein
MPESPKPGPPKGAPLPWRALCGVGGIVKSALTGSDGESWAPGRIMGFGVFIVGQCLVIRAAHSVLLKGLTPADWKTFFEGVSAFEFVDCSVAIGLVLGMAPTDAGGKWWSKDSKGPPPVMPQAADQ